MKSTVIKINNVSDIDVSRVSIYDLDNRYVDVKGNIYGLKFDYDLRKMKVVRIIRTPKADASLIQQQILMKKFYNPPEVNAKTAEPENNPDTKKEVESFNPSMVIREILENVDSHKARLRGIMMNIKNSNLFSFSRENEEKNRELESLFRSIDTDCILQFDKVTAYEKELSTYPHSITGIHNLFHGEDHGELSMYAHTAGYHKNKAGSQTHTAMEQLADNEEAMKKFMYAHEMYNSLLHVYETLHNVLVSLSDLLKKRAAVSKAGDPRALADAQISITNTIAEIDGIFEKLKPFDEYLKHAENFYSAV